LADGKFAMSKRKTLIMRRMQVPNVAASHKIIPKPIFLK